MSKKIKKGYVDLGAAFSKSQWEEVEILSEREKENEGGSYICYLIRRKDGKIEERSNVYLIR